MMYLLSHILVLTSLLPSVDVSTVIFGFVDENVILPCSFPPNERFSHSTINIFWKFKSENIPVHYVLEGAFQREMQHEKFTERTNLFSKEFSKGNASLLLKNIQVSDTGLYECFVWITEHKSTDIELIVIAKTYGYTNKSSIIAISLPVVIFSIVVASCIFSRRRKRSRGKTATTDSAPGEEARDIRKDTAREVTTRRQKRQRR